MTASAAKHSNVYRIATGHRNQTSGNRTRGGMMLLKMLSSSASAHHGLRVTGAGHHSTALHGQERNERIGRVGGCWSSQCLAHHGLRVAGAGRARFLRVRVPILWKGVRRARAGNNVPLPAAREPYRVTDICIYMCVVKRVATCTDRQQCTCGGEPNRVTGLVVCVCVCVCLLARNPMNPARDAAHVNCVCVGVGVIWV